MNWNYKGYLIVGKKVGFVSAKNKAKMATDYYVYNKDNHVTTAYSLKNAKKVIDRLTEEKALCKEK